MTGRRAVTVVALAAVLVLEGACAARAPEAVLGVRSRFTGQIALPAPVTEGAVPLEQAIAGRRSQRAFRDTPLSLAEIGQLLWAGQGVTSPDGKRAAPSAGALYPLELYVVTSDGVMHYLPSGHRAEVRADSDRRPQLQRAARDQDAVGAAPAVIVVAAASSRTRQKYGSLAPAFVNREAGHATQNMLLEATALGLAAVPVGSFDEAAVAATIPLPASQEALYLVPVGHPG